MSILYVYEQGLRLTFIIGTKHDAKYEKSIFKAFI